MQILVVDDSAEKAANVIQVIVSALPDEALAEPVVKGSMSEAVQALASQPFDLIVLDLMVPYVPGGKTDRTAGLELLRQVRGQDALSRNAVVIGLSAFPEEAASVRSDFDSNTVVLIEYDRAGKWKVPISRAAQDSYMLSSKRAELDFLVLVALPEEAAPYDSLAVELTTSLVVDGLNVQLLTHTATGARGALVRLRQMGLVAASIDTAMAITAFRPRIVAMSGICAGFSGRSTLGQLIVPTPAWEYQAGKWSTDGFMIAPDQVHLRPPTRVILAQLIEKPGLIVGLEKAITITGDRPSKVVSPALAPGVTGSAVIAAKERLDQIEKQHRKVAALDMETYGVYKAAHEASHFVDHFFAAKVVVDLADSEKDDDLHEYGSALSAAFCIQAIEEILSAA